MRFLLRNWQLKLGAVALATVLYTGLVYSGAFSEGSIQVPIRPSDLPNDVAVLTGTPGTVEVAYRVATEDADRVEPDSFVATVDLSGYDMDRAAEPQVLAVNVESLVDSLDVVSFEPASVTVILDRVDERTVPVVVVYEPVPDGLDADTPQVDVDEVVARGPVSLLRTVDHAIARVLIDSSGIDVERPDVRLEAVDVDEQPVDNIELTPSSVFVRIDVRTVETETTVPIRLDVSGTPAPGFALEGLTIEPSAVTLRGLPAILTEIRTVVTEPVSIADASADQTFDVALVLPEGTRLADESAEPIVTVTATISPTVSSRTFVAGLVCQGGAGANSCLPGLDQISVTLSGPGVALDSLTAGDVTGILNISGLGAGQHTVDVSLAALPAGVEVETIAPASVSVTIVAPATPVPTPTPAP